MRRTPDDMFSTLKFVPAINGDEMDATSPTVRAACTAFNRPGVARRTRARMNRRERHAARQILNHAARVRT